tara:strand:- start:44 stop:541 length:498 start_codon:yes stop_codon:yes gene_type:complete
VKGDIMIENKSRITSEVIQQTIKLDITKRGFYVMEGPPESPYDLVVDIGLIDGKRIFKTIQVKKDIRTTSRPGSGNGEPVSRNGKNRNSYNYYDKDIDFIASLDKYGEPYYIEKENYKYKSSSELNKNLYSLKTPWPFKNDNVSSYRKPCDIKNIEDQDLTLKIG